MTEGMNFSFGRRQENVDWRKLASVDIERIMREMDVKTLQDNIMHITFCNIESELGMRGVAFDPNYIKLFRLSQLIIEYLLHSQQFLSANLEAENKMIRDANEAAEKAKQDLEARTEAYNKLKKECRKQKKWISEYQLLMRAGASGSHKCPFCAKAFVSQEYVLAHMTRRHGDHSSQVNGTFISAAPVKSVGAVTMETKRGMTEQEKNSLVEELREIKERLQRTERELNDERLSKDRQAKSQSLAEKQRIEELEQNFEQWKINEQEKQKQDMANLQEKLFRELQNVREQKDLVSQALSELQEKTRVKPSMIGSIRDEDEPDSPAKGRRDEVPPQVIAQFETQVLQLQNETNQNLQMEIQKIQKKLKAKEELSQKKHREEMRQFQDILTQVEENLQNERLEKERLSKDYENRIQMISVQMQELGRALESRKVETERIQQSFNREPPLTLASSLPVPAPRKEQPVQASAGPTERERAKTPDRSATTGDTVALYVSSNQNKTQYRLWRQTADGSNEWSDQFAFFAFVKPARNFTFPLYVFAAGGSPYWRQYVSANSVPPSPEYRLDYMFHASTTSFPGALQCFVLDAGSIPVIRSRVSRSKNVPGWKDKGLSFFVLRAEKTGTNVSASFESTLTEDKEQDFEPSESESEDEVPSPAVPRVQVEHADAVDTRQSIESVEEAEDIKEITSGLSSSEWGTTTLEPGEFRPFPHNKLIISRFDHKFDEVQACREEIVQIVEQTFSKQGIPPESNRLSTQKMEARMAALKTERQARAKKNKNFTELRHNCALEMEDIVKKTYRSKSPTGNTGSTVSPGPRPGAVFSAVKPPTFKSTATAVRTSTALQQGGRKSPAARGTLTSTGSTSGGDMTLSVTSVTERSFSATSVTERTLSESEEEVSVTERSQEGEEDSNWDSEEEPARPKPQSTHKVAVHIPSQEDVESDSEIEELAAVTARPNPAPRGEKVRELAASLERSLNLGSSTKKPAGGVSLHFQGNQHQKPAVQRPVNRQNENDFDDDSDFSLSSDEDNIPPRRKPEQVGGLPQASAVTRSPFRQDPVTAFKKPQTTQVRDFHGDFSDFDDDDLDVENIT